VVILMLGKNGMVKRHGKKAQVIMTQMKK